MIRPSKWMTHRSPLSGGSFEEKSGKAGRIFLKRKSYCIRRLTPPGGTSLPFGTALGWARSRESAHFGADCRVSVHPRTRTPG